MKLSYYNNGKFLSKQEAYSMMSDVEPHLESVIIPENIELPEDTRNLTTYLRYAYYDEKIRKLMETRLFRPLPITLKYNLMPHQVEVIMFMRKIERIKAHNTGMKGGILHLDMGLGKSLISIAHSLIAPSSQGVGTKPFPTLIIVSKSLLSTWKRDTFQKFFDNRVRVLYFHKDFISEKKMNNISRSKLREYQFVLTTYEVLSAANKLKNYQSRCLAYQGKKVVGVRSVSKKTADKPQYKGLHVLYCTPWERIICDESQTICNFKSERFRNCKALYGEHIWCLSGTPIKNSHLDLWAQFSFCGFSLISSPNGRLGFRASHYTGFKLYEFVLSMNYTQANITLPTITYNNVPLTMSKRERRLYIKKLEGIQRLAVQSGPAIYAYVLSKIMDLRQFCNAPFLGCLESKEIKSSMMVYKILKAYRGPWPSNPLLEGGVKSPKISAIIDLIKNVKQKTIIFSSFSRFLRLVKIALDIECIKSHLYIGDFTFTQNQKHLNDFRDNENVKVLLMTYQIGSIGINITEANVVICAEPWWNHVMIDQGIRRVWRIGQNNNVRVFNFSVKCSIEEPIWKLTEQKRNMAKSVINRDISKTHVESKLSMVELRKILDEGM